MLEKINSKIFNFLLLFFISLSIIFYSPSFFEILENDSLSYINNESIRFALYPSLIDFFETNYNYVIIFQVIFLALSIVFLVQVLSEFVVNKFLRLFFFLVILLNFYYTSFSKSILTEAVYFSFINFSIGLFLIRNRIQNSLFTNFIIGFFIGGVMAIKPEGLLITLFLSIIYIIKQKENLKRIIFVVSLCILPFTENMIFYNFHNERNTVLDKSIIGKIFILSGYYENKIEIEKDYNFIEIVSEKSKPVNTYLKNISNPFLKFNLKSDYEVVGQYQLSEILGEKNIFIKIEKEKIDIFKNLLINSPFDFMSLCISNYLAIWMPGGKQIFFEEYLKDNPLPPYSNLLEKSSGKIMDVNKNILLTVLIFFFIMLIINILITLCSLYELLKTKFSNNFDLNIIMILINLHLLVISTINIASPRYLMPFFPVIILIIFIRFNKIFKY